MKPTWPTQCSLSSVAAVARGVFITLVHRTIWSAVSGTVGGGVLHQLKGIYSTVIPFGLYLLTDICILILIIVIEELKPLYAFLSSD